MVTSKSEQKLMCVAGGYAPMPGCRCTPCSTARLNQPLCPHTDADNRAGEWMCALCAHAELEHVKKTLTAVVDAWESLRGERHHDAVEVERWLYRIMAPAIQKARAVLGRRRPS